MGEIKISSINFDKDTAIIWYRISVGENSNAVCHIEIPNKELDTLFTEENLIRYIKKQDEIYRSSKNILES